MNPDPIAADARTREHGPDEEVSLVDLLIPLVQHWKLLVVAPLVLGLAALGATFLMTPTFVAKTVVMPPQPSSSAGSVLASLGDFPDLPALPSGHAHRATSSCQCCRATGLQTS